MMASTAMGLASGLPRAVPQNASKINLNSMKGCQWGTKEGVMKNRVSFTDRDYDVHCRAYNVQVFVGENESEDDLLKRFRRAVWEAGVISECRRRRYFESPQDAFKRKNQILRNKKKRRYARAKSSKEEEKSKDGAEDDENENDDDWGGRNDDDWGGRYDVSVPF
ncbi:hypothetical protein KI387_020683 [Taxus chinensis]|uniref:30S ribosomal protein S21, chloroplastic n=1 Tax=Taxus chinensis TaxID=29808 RepID=A0AA38GBS4_TAXCH|nr:hypothetical protein KI387_020683 [Taxus chinensis]